MRIYIPCLIVSLLLGCANPVVPTGGPKDITPPRIENIIVSETKGSTTVTFYFNEEVTLFQPERNIILAPSSKHTTTSSTGHHSVTLNITGTEKLDPLSYIQLLKGWVQDLNEKNPTDSIPFFLLKNLPYKIDSNIISGTINAINEKQPGTLRIYITDSVTTDHSLISRYYTMPSRSGNFMLPSFAYTTNTKYIIVNDLNLNHIIDSNEYFNITPFALHDSLKPHLTYCPSIRKTDLKFETDSNLLRITGTKGNKLLVPDITYYHEDTAYIPLEFKQKPTIILDEDSVPYHVSSKSNNFELSIKPFEYNISDSSLILITNLPVQSKLKDSLIISWNDSTKHAQFYNIDRKHLIRLKPIKPGSFSLIITDSTFKTNNNIFNKKKNIEVNTEKIMPGTINVSRKAGDTLQYIVYLKQKEYYDKYLIAPSESSIVIKKVPGTYDLLIVHDADYNKSFTKSSLRYMTGEEPVGVIRNVIISNKLQNNITLDPSGLFTNVLNNR